MIPTKKQQRLDWLADHLPMWSENAEDIGLSEEQISALQSFFTAANSAWNTAKTSRNTAKNNTIAANTAFAAMNNFLGAMVKTIRSHAQATGNEEVYAQAGINPPAPPTAQPAPGMPTDVTTTVDNMGRIVLRWKATHSAPSSGAAFEIRRKLSFTGGSGENKYKVIGTAQSRTFTDDSIPTGTASATYIIKGYRGNTAGQPGEPVVVYLHSVETGGEQELGLAA